MDVAGLLSETAARFSHKTAFVSEDGSEVSFAALDRAVDRVASALQRFGVVKGDRVAIGMPNRVEFAEAYLGTLRAGAVAVPLNVMLTVPEVSTILRDSGARVALASPPFAGVVGDAASAARSIEHVFSTDDWAELLADTGSFEAPGVVDDDLAVLAYTSGTTGEPKGAMLSHGNLVANLRQQMAVPEDEVTQDDVLLLALPLFHIFGLNVTLGLVIMNGATGLLLSRFDPESSLRLIEQHNVTVLFGAPPMYVAWLAAAGGGDYDLSSVRVAVSGAAPLPPEVLRGFKETFGIDIFEGYGLTETAPTLTSSRMAEAPRPGSVGRPLPGVELRLVDVTGADVEVGDPGEVLVRGPNVFKGYWGRDDETARAFEGGWFHTGDIAVQDEDGYLYLVDRKRDLIIVSGFNVYPAEVENALMANPKVADAAVVGMAHPYSGEAVKAYVVLEPGVEATPEELRADVGLRLARFKCPEEIVIVEELPHLLTGKVLRRALRT